MDLLGAKMSAVTQFRCRDCGFQDKSAPKPPLYCSQCTTCLISHALKCNDLLLLYYFLYFLYPVDRPTKAVFKSVKMLLPGQHCRIRRFVVSNHLCYFNVLNSEIFHCGNTPLLKYQSRASFHVHLLAIPFWPLRSVGESL